MECPETAPYAAEICDAVENELESLGCAQELVDAAKKHFLYTNSTPPDPPSHLSIIKLQILSAWHWLVRIPAKEAALKAAISSGASMSDLEGPFDLAYSCVLPAPLGYGIHRVEAPPFREPVFEEVAILLDASRVTKEPEDTTALWKSQGQLF